jgi:hypothetical protein
MAKIGKVIRDQALLPKLAKKHTVADEAASAARAQFLLRRGNAALAANPSWKGASADEVKDAAKATFIAQLLSDVTIAALKVATLQLNLGDATQTETVGIDDASVDPKARFRTTYMKLFKQTPNQFRATAIVTAAWATLADDLTISDADLHSLVSRRLMVVERMMWYIGSVDSRAWNITGTNEWRDGWNRIFEYPRLWVAKPFASLCNPDSNGVCDTNGKMAGWTKRFGGQFRHAYQVGSGAGSFWSFVSPYHFSFKRGGGNDPADAVKKVFEPSTDFRKRSLLMCDHVIQCLHLEALVRVKSKRDGGTTWFKTMEAAESKWWLEITNPSAFDDDKDPNDPKVLGLETEPRFFKREKIDVRDVQVGDHVIIYNHPAYDEAKESVNVWRLENAVVVATSPGILLQGHGTNPLPFTSTRTIPVKADKTASEPAMRLNMLGLFNKKLDEYRAAAVAENAKTNPATSVQVGDADARLVQRTVLGPYSGYDLSQFSTKMKAFARWWIRWDHSLEHNEPAIAADSAWAQQIWDHMRVELLDDGSVVLLGGSAFFPLWLPRMTKAGPYRSGGKISVVQRVFVDQTMAPGWSWYYDKDELPDPTARHKVTARRPKVS